MNLLTLLALVDIKECDDDYCQLIIERANAIATLKDCELDELSLRDVIHCIETAGNEFEPPELTEPMSGAEIKAMSQQILDLHKEGGKIQFPECAQTFESPTYAPANTRTLVIPGINPDDLYNDMDLSDLLEGNQP